MKDARVASINRIWQRMTKNAASIIRKMIGSSRSGELLVLRLGTLSIRGLCEAGEREEEEEEEEEREEEVAEEEAKDSGLDRLEMLAMTTLAMRLWQIMLLIADMVQRT